MRESRMIPSATAATQAVGSRIFLFPISSFFSRFAIMTGAALITTSTTVMITTTSVDMALMLGFTLLLMVYTMMLRFFTPLPVTK